MHSLWHQPLEERIIQWRHFRIQLIDPDPNINLIEVAKFWKSAPSTDQIQLQDDPSVWPKPWDLLAFDRFCDLSKCLGLYFTVILSDIFEDLSISIDIYYDTDGISHHLVNIQQGKFILNLVEGQVCSVEDIPLSFQKLFSFNEDDIKL